MQPSKVSGTTPPPRTSAVKPGSQSSRPSAAPSVITGSFPVPTENAGDRPVQAPKPPIRYPHA